MQRRRVRFTTAAALVNQLVEAQREHSLSRMLARWSRVELIVIDELGYVPLAEVAAELLFQVIAERAEKAAVIVTTNLPFSEWPQVFTNARLCKAMLDRLTDQAHIIETGSSRTASEERCGRRRSNPRIAWVFGSASAPPSGLRSSRTEHPQPQRPKGWAKTNRRSGPKQVAKEPYERYATAICRGRSSPSRRVFQSNAETTSGSRGVPSKAVKFQV